MGREGFGGLGLGHLVWQNPGFGDGADFLSKKKFWGGERKNEVGRKYPRVFAGGWDEKIRG